MVLYSKFIRIWGYIVMIFTNFKEIDKTGRIVISKDIRKHLCINDGDILHIEADDKCIIITKAEDKCVFCNSPENLTKFNDKFICSKCIEKLTHTDGKF